MSIDEKLDRIESKLDKHINHDYHNLKNTVTNIDTTVKEIKKSSENGGKYWWAGIVTAALLVVSEILRIFF